MPKKPKGLYIDPKKNKVINTHSMLKTFRRCPKQAQFKYVERLKPKIMAKPLHRGTWIHELLEVYHSGGDWVAHHKKLCAKFNELFDEERDYYGDLPTEIEAIMRSYVWHYRDDTWKVHEVEQTLEAELPDGSLYRGKVDALVENQFGLWLVDHKSHKTLPDISFRLLDAQSALYIWAAWENGIPVQGFIWNYLRWKAPSTPPLVSNNTRLSKSPCDTDFPTYVRALKQYREEFPDSFHITPEYKREAARLKAHRYEFGKTQTSTFFRRDVLEKQPAMVERVVKENYHTALRMNSYDFSDEGMVERVVDRSCTFSCSYVDLCTADLMGTNADLLRRQNYKQGDPNSYYNDRAGDVPD